MTGVVNYDDWYNQLARFLPETALTADIKSTLEDFQVDEQLGFEPAGEGEHVFLFIEKRGLTTADVVEKLSGLSGASSREIGYSGLKDKWAITRQWFSVQLPGKQAQQVDWSALDSHCESGTSVTLLKQSLHNRKLRRGTHRENLFRLRLRNLRCADNSPLDDEVLAQRLRQVSQEGFPNYFGYQRFGHQFRNIAAALDMFKSRRRQSRSRRSIYLSAARSYCFNELLSSRLRAQRWNQFDEEDCLMLNGTTSFFSAGTEAASEAGREQLQSRLASGDLHVAGILPGDDWLQQCSGSDRDALAACEAFLQGLQSSGMRSDRRALRAIPGELAFNFLPSRQSGSQQDLQIFFSLQKGQFATALLRELCIINDISQLSRAGQSMPGSCAGQGAVS